MVNDAFYDVAHGSRSDTKTILAYDALRAMPRMDESEFHALALLLLSITLEIQTITMQATSNPTPRSMSFRLSESFPMNTAVISSLNTCTAYPLKTRISHSDR